MTELPDDNDPVTPDSTPLTESVTGDIGTPDKTVSLAEAAQRLGVSERTILRRIDKGLLRARKVDTSHGMAWRITLDNPNATRATVRAARTFKSAEIGRGAEAVTRDMSPQTAPEVRELVRLVDRLQQETSEKGEKIAELTGAAAHWQTRAIVAEEQARRAEEQIKLLMAPKDEPAEETPAASEPRRSWWRRLFDG